jgi:hypothetical protein
MMKFQSTYLQWGSNEAAEGMVGGDPIVGKYNDLAACIMTQLTQWKNRVERFFLVTNVFTAFFWMICKFTDDD